MQTFDAIAGDVTIMSSRHDDVDFTQPYTESGLEMIVPIRSKVSNQPWLFLKPFTAKMWWLIAAITLYNGFVIWLIERRHCEHLRGSVVNQIGVVIWLAFMTLFTLRGKIPTFIVLVTIIMLVKHIIYCFINTLITRDLTLDIFGHRGQVT